MYVTMYLSISRNIKVAVLQHGIVSFVTSSGRRDGIVSFDYYIAISTHTHAGTHAHTHTHTIIIIITLYLYTVKHYQLS